MAITRRRRTTRRAKRGRFRRPKSTTTVARAARHVRRRKYPFYKKPHWFPGKGQYLKLKWNTRFRWAVPAVEQAYQYMMLRGNSVYDPDYSSTGTSVQWLPYISLLYKEYQVMGSKIRVQFGITANDVGKPVNGWILRVADDKSIPSNALASYNQAVRKTTQFNPLGERHPVLTAYCSTKKAFDRSPSDVDLVARMEANPSRQWFWVFCAGMQYTESSTVVIEGTIEMTYYVVVRNASFNYSEGGVVLGDSTTTWQTTGNETDTDPTEEQVLS